MRYPDSYAQVLYQETESIPILLQAVGLFPSEACGQTDHDLWSLLSEAILVSVLSLKLCMSKVES